MAQLYSTITEIMVRDLALNINSTEIARSWSLRNELGMDSTEMVQLMCSIEETFGVRFPKYRMADWDTVDDFIRFVATHVGIDAE